MAKKQALKKPKVKKPAAQAAALKQKDMISSYDKWIVGLCYAILIVVPLIFSRISYDQFDLVKLAALRVLVLGMAVAWGAKLLSKREPIRWSWREGLLVAFLLVAIVSTITSIHIPTALHGKYKRYEGLFTFITYIVAYSIAAQAFKDKRRLTTLMEIVSLTGAAVALYGIFQFIGLDPIYWGDVPFEQRRSFSTFGNPDLLAGYLVLAFPCALIAYFHGHKRFWLHGLAAFILATGLLTALTRGGWLGALVGMICVGVFLGRSLKAQWKKILVLVAPILLVLAVLVAYSSTINLDIVSKFHGAFQFNAGTAMSRFQIWKAGWRMVKDRPLFGQGLDTYRLASEHFETRQYVRSVSGTTVSDNAHNYFVQLAAGGGPIAAFLLYGFFIAWIARMIKVRRQLEDNTERLMVTGALSAVIGYLASMLTGISIVGAGSTFWLLMAAMTGFTANLDPAYRAFDVGKWSRQLKLAIASGLLLVSVAGAGFAVSMYVGDVFLVRGLIAAAGGQEAAAASNFNTAITLYPGNGRIMSEQGQAYTRWASAAARQQDQKGFAYFTQQAIKSFERANRSEPPEVDYRVFLANSLSHAGQYKRALDLLDGVLAQRPYSVPGNLLRGQFLSDLGRKDEAIRHYETVIFLSPEYQAAYSALVGLYKERGNKLKADYYQKKLDEIRAKTQ